MKKTVKKTARAKKRPAKPARKARKAKAAVHAARARRAAKATAPTEDRRSAEDQLTELKQRLLEISDLGAVGSVLGWDEATYMPKGGAAARGRQSATLSRACAMSARSIPRSAG